MSSTSQLLKGFRDFLPKHLQDPGRVAVFIDAANLQKSSQKLGWRIDYRKLSRLLCEYGSLQHLGYYTVEPRTERQHMFMKALKRFQYLIVSKPVKRIHERRGAEKRKANFDVEIATDIALALHRFDTLVLFSGDSDFAYSVDLAKKNKKVVIVVSTKYRISRELVQRAHYYLELKKLRELLERPKKSPSFSTGDKSSLSTARRIIQKK